MCLGSAWGVGAGVAGPRRSGKVLRDPSASSPPTSTFLSISRPCPPQEGPNSHLLQPFSLWPGEMARPAPPTPSPQQEDFFSPAPTTEPTACGPGAVL